MSGNTFPVEIVSALDFLVNKTGTMHSRPTAGHTGKGHVFVGKLARMRELLQLLLAS
jgi:hypothetical protein